MKSIIIYDNKEIKHQFRYKSSLHLLLNNSQLCFKSFLDSLQIDDYIFPI